ncbi:MAG TPA: V-type ATP synthase subunit D [Syntrophorhabdaceae bacterium]|nr:V-type ATP synthase subunit D [Syntrophorhabdaceae bacterium]HQM80027.1 V-type ATP synthase subunit D [Syntrophorhabdaceae bacterium]
MGKLNIAPTKSNLLILKRKLAFAEEGYDLLEQKRQILIFELMSRVSRARNTEQATRKALRQAYEALREARLDGGSEAIDRAALAVKMDHQVEISDQHLMGMKIPHVTVKTEPVSAQFGVGGTPANADIAMSRFVEALSLIAEMAELENALRRIAMELRKTQRRCNALSKIFMPTYRETIVYITADLEERERESFVILKMIRDRIS